MFAVLNNVSNAVVNEMHLLCQRRLFNTMRGYGGTCVNIGASEIRVVLHKREPNLNLVKSFSLNPAGKKKCSRNVLTSCGQQTRVRTNA
jgi:hypothetical protein